MNTLRVFMQIYAFESIQLIFLTAKVLDRKLFHLPNIIENIILRIFYIIFFHIVCIMCDLVSSNA